MPSHTGAQRGRHILGDIHPFATLIVQTEQRLCHKGLLLHSRLRAQGSGYIMEIPHFVTLVGGKSNGCFFFCLDISVPAAFTAIEGRPCSGFFKNAAALHIPWGQASPACIIRASLSWGGSSLPRASALLSIPKQAVLLK